MWLPVAIACLLLAYGLTVVLQALLLRRVADWLGVPEITFLRALLTAACIALACLVIAMPAAAGRWTLGEASLGGPNAVLPWVQAAIPYLVFGLEIGAACLIVWWLWRTAWDQVVLAALVDLVTLLVAVFALNAGARLAFFEAVVVPAGGMAPAVCGVHATVCCPNCGFSYEVDMSDRMQAPRWSARQKKPTVCPNCRAPSTLSPDVPVRQGEQILIENRAEYERWRLILLRHARKPGAMLLDRLVGLPGESVEILGGDVFLDGRRLQKPPETLADMWIPVHDTSFVPAQRAAEPTGWRPASGSAWREQSGRWTVTATGASSEELEFAGRIRDELAYNEPPDETQGKPNAAPAPAQASPAPPESGAKPRAPAPTPAVADVRLECTLEDCSNGIFEIRWEYLRCEVVARIASSGRLHLAVQDHSRDPADAMPAREADGSLTGALQAGTQITFVQRDGLAYLAQFGRVLASVPVGPERTKDMQRWLVRERQPECRLKLAMSGGTLALRRLILWRDVYYRSLPEMAGAPSFARLDASDPAPLAPNTYFVLGDNSAHSEDSRFFGPVSGTAIVGTAHWVYWPPSRWRGL